MGHSLCKFERGFDRVNSALHQLWCEESGQDVAEYSVMLAVVLVIVVGTIRLIGSNAGNIFSQVGSTIQ
jgi:Flp pilus assembly pilin Flp